MFKKSSKNQRRRPNQEQTRPSGQVFSYYQNRDTRDKDAGRTVTAARAARLRKSHIPTYFALAVCILCAGYILSLSSQPKVIVVNDQAQAVQSLLRPRQVYQKAVTRRMQSSPFNYSKLTINTRSLMADLRNDFPELANASMTVPLAGRRPIVYLNIAQPTFIMNSQNNSFVLDPQGRVLLKTTEVPAVSKLHLVVINDEVVNGAASIGKPVLPANHITVMQAIVGQLKAKGLAVESMTLPARASEVQVRAAGLPYFIKFNLLSDARQQAGTLLAIKQRLEADKVTPAEYIDVRVDERAYYK